MPKDEKKQVTKRQHWLPIASYLENFTNNGKVKTYWLKDGRRGDFLKTAEQKDIAPINFGVKKDLYENPALPVNTIEESLAYLEGLYLNILKNKIIKHKSLNEEEHDQVALYIGALENRTMLQKKHWEGSMDRLEKMGRQIALAHNSPEAADRWSEKIKVAKDSTFTDALLIAMEVDKWRPLDFCFLVIPESIDAEFITSDHPVTLTDLTKDNSFYGLTHWSETAECLVPLTPKIALFGNMCGIKGYKDVDYNFVREVNNRVLRRADKVLVSKQPIESKEADAITRHNTQSLILNFIKLPKGRAAKGPKKAKEKEPPKDDPKSKEV